MITLALIFVAYWLPSLLAFHRGHKNRLPILMVNFLLGWTIFGWIVALIWACTGNTEPVTIVVYR